MEAGTIRACAIRAAGFTDDTSAAAANKSALVNEIERMLVEVHNEVKLEDSKIILQASPVALRVDVAQWVRSTMLPVPS